MKIKLLKKALENEQGARTEAEHIAAEKSTELSSSIKQLCEINKLTAAPEFAVKELKQSIKTTNVPIFSLNKKGLIEGWNKASVNITGYKKKEVINKDPVQTYIAKDYQKSVTKILCEALLGKETANYEFLIYSKYGQHKMISFNVSPRYDVNGKINGVLGVGQRITEIIFQNKEKDKRANELILANEEKEKRADELAIANRELTFQNEEKDKRANELILANEEKEKKANELVVANEELNFQNKEKRKRANELILANKELAFQNEEKGKRADELLIANKELNFQNEEKRKRADELIIANKELAYQMELDNYRSEMERVALDLMRLIDTANAPIFGIDNHGLVNEWNQTSEKITGFTKNEVLGKDLVKTYITEDYQESVKQVLDDALLGKETANYEFPLFAKDGARVMVLLNSSTRRDANGKIIGVLGVGQNITQIDTLRTASESTAKELRQFIETANAPIFGIDNHGLVNEWNQTSEKITGFTKYEVLGKDLVKTYITEDYQESVKQVLDDAFLGKETANYEFPLFAKDGARVMVLLNSSTRRDANGKIIGVLGVGQNITELVSYRKQLELMVDQRTLKLNKALKKEKELSELKSKFVSTASHEFRTPLSAINFAAGSIKKYWAKMEPIMIEQKLHKIEDQVKHMTNLLDDILIVGQAEAGKIIYNPMHINLGRFIQEIIEEVDNSYNKSHKIVLIDAEDLKHSDIFIDEKLGRNIFINIVSNAIKFSPNANKIVIEFSTEKNHIVISVTDFGIGIPESELKTIFTPFSRGKNVDLIQGTGLGLSIVKEAIDILGGKIIIHSTKENGTSFIIKIPKK